MPHTTRPLFPPPLSRIPASWRFGLKSALLVAVFISVTLFRLLPSNGSTIAPRDRDSLRPRDAFFQTECRLVQHVDDQCEHVKQFCQAEDSGPISYLQLYYCRFGDIKLIGLMLLMFWIAALFCTIGVAASDFFCLNLNTISSMLGLSESLAGVTLLAFGNGSPDLFSTFAAMKSHHGGLAIGELFGAAGFITAFVIGAMALERPFEISDTTFIRDVTFFIVATISSLWFLSDEVLHVWESASMVLFYFAYVLTVVFWPRGGPHSFRESRMESSAQGQIERASLDSGSEPSFVGARVDGIEVWGCSPLNLADQANSLLHHPPLSPIEQGLSSGRNFVATQINHDMHLVNFPFTSRSTLPCLMRPSLLGVLEFRSFLSNLENDRTPLLGGLSLRRDTWGQGDHSQSDQEFIRRAGSTSLMPVRRRRSSFASRYRQRRRTVSTNDALDFNNRFLQESQPMIRGLLHDRAISSSGIGGHEPINLSSPGTVLPRDTRKQCAHAGLYHSPDRLSSDYHWTSRSPQGHQPSSSMFREVSSFADLDQNASASQLPRPGTVDHRRVSFSSSNPYSRAAVSPSNSHFQCFSVGSEHTRSLPRSFSPPSIWADRLLLSDAVAAAVPILFPTLATWDEKSFLERVFGLLSAPSFFLLTVTLPVVGNEKGGGLEAADTAEQTRNLSCGLVDRSSSAADPLVQAEYGTIPLQSTQGSQYFDFEPDSSDHLPVCDHSPDVLGSDPSFLPAGCNLTQCSHDTALPFSAHNRLYINTAPQPGQALTLLSAAVAQNSLCDNADTEGYPATPLWSRWLLLIQIFTAPLFLMFCLYYNTNHLLGKKLSSICLGSLLVSLVLFALVLRTTSPHELPTWHRYLSIAGFILGIAWISTVASEVVSILKALGIILNLSDAILGLTVFAVGNSLGDLFANITFARLGFPVMALSACIGSPMLNILLGIGVTGLYLALSAPITSSTPYWMWVYKIEITPTLLRSGFSLLVTLFGLVCVVPARGWKLDRAVGITLLSIWTVSTIAIVAAELLDLRPET